MSEHALTFFKSSTFHGEGENQEAIKFSGLQFYKADVRKDDKKLNVEELESPSSLESFVTCKLIPLDKKSGLRPIDIGKVFKNDITISGYYTLKG